MTDYEKDLQAAYDEGLDVKEKELKSDAAALISGNKVAINRRILSTTKEKACALAEERGHYHTSVGNILDLEVQENQKQEYKARLWGYNDKIGLYGLIRAHNARKFTIEDAADFFNVTEKYLLEALDCYRSKYGTYVRIDNYAIIFEPRLIVIQYFNTNNIQNNDASLTQN